MRRLTDFLVAAAATLGVASAGMAAHAADAVKVGFMAGMYDAPIILAVKNGYFKDANVDVTLVRFGNAVDAGQALSVGQIDALPTLVVPGLLNASMRGINVKGVASAGENMPGYGNISMVLRKSLIDAGKYKGPSDLGGLTLVTAQNSSAHWFIAELAKTGKVDLASIKVISVGLPNIIAGMNNGAIDGGSVIEPFATMMVEKGQGVRVASIDTAFPNFPAAYLWYGDSLLKRTDDLGTRFLTAFMRGIRLYKAGVKDGVHSDDLLAALQASEIQASKQTTALGYPDDGRMSTQHLDRYLEWVVSTGAMRQAPDLKGALDDRFRQTALKALEK